MADQTATETNPVEVVSNLTDTVNKHFAESKQQTEKLAEKYTANAEKIEKLTARIELAEKNAAMPSFSNSSKNKELTMYEKSFNSWMMRGPQPDISLANDYVNSVKFGTQSIESINPSGGYFVPTPIATRLQERQFATSPMRKICSVMQVTSDSQAFWYTDEESEAKFGTETSNRDDNTDSPNVGEMTITVKDIYANPYASNNLIADSLVNIQNFLVNNAWAKIVRTQNKSFIHGEGVMQPRGLLSYEDWATPDVYERDKLNTHTSQQAGSISIDDLIDMTTYISQFDYSANAKWIMSAKTWGEIQKISSTTDIPLISNTFLETGANSFNLLGYPIAFMHDMPDVATGNMPIILGDFQQGYQIIDRSGMYLLVNPYKKNGSTQFYLATRYGGAVTQWQAFVRLKIS